MPTGDAYSSRHLVPSLWDLHMFYLLRPILFRTCRYFTGLCSSNIPRYFLDFALYKTHSCRLTSLKNTSNIPNIKCCRAEKVDLYFELTTVLYFLRWIMREFLSQFQKTHCRQLDKSHAWYEVKYLFLQEIWIYTFFGDFKNVSLFFWVHEEWFTAWVKQIAWIAKGKRAEVINFILQPNRSTLTSNDEWVVIEQRHVILFKPFFVGYLFFVNIYGVRQKMQFLQSLKLKLVISPNSYDLFLCVREQNTSEIS